MRKQRRSFTVTAKLISVFVFATWIVQYLFFLNLKFHACSLFLRLYRPLCVGPCRKPGRLFVSCRGSFDTCPFDNWMYAQTDLIVLLEFAVCFLYISAFSSEAADLPVSVVPVYQLEEKNMVLVACQ